MASVLKSYECFSVRTACIGREGKYLQSVYREEAGGSRIEASADAVAGNARTRFFVEASKKEDALVHVRCCYNNKYWVPVKDTGSDCWVVGTADEPMEDLSSPSCTLFAPMAANLVRGRRIRFHHPSLQKYVCVSSIHDEAKPHLQLAEDAENKSGFFIVLGLSQQKELPKYIAIKKPDGSYFRLMSRRECFRNFLGWTLFPPDPFVLPDYMPPDGPVLVFDTKDKGDADVMCTILTNDDGTVRIQSTKSGYFWKRDHRDWIVPNEGKNWAGDHDNLFKVIRGDDGFISLRNLGNGRILKKKTDERNYDYLSAEETSLSEHTQFKYDEAVKEEHSYDVKYNVEEARTYDVQIVTSQAHKFTNHGDRDSTESISFVQKIQKEITWQTSVSEKTGVEVGITVGTGAKSPINVSGGVKVSKENTSSQGNETSEAEGQDITLTHVCTVPPGQTLAVQLVATRSSSDIPYSYKRHILLTTGEPITSIHDDGICTVKNNYGFEIKESNKPDEIKRMLAEKNATL